MNIERAAVIATRYAMVRRQFSTQDGTTLERKLIDYQTHQFKIIPLVAYSYAFIFSSYRLMAIHKQLLIDIKTKNFGLLEQLHHLSSGFKACYTKIAYEGIDTLR